MSQEEQQPTELIASFDIGRKNLALCVIDKQENIHHWEIFDITASTNGLICKRMVQQLDKVDILKNVNVVLVEKQPHFNPSMRVIQGYVSTYFIIRGVDNGKNVKVIDYSAKHKLNCYDGIVPEYKVKSEYSIRKKTGIFHTQQLIKDKQKQHFIDDFSNSKKKDDYADSFLQALSYIRYNEEKNVFVIGKVTPRKPSTRQAKYKKYSRPNLKYLLLEDLKKCLYVQQDNNPDFVNSQIPKYNTIDFLTNWIEFVDGIKKNILSTYEYDYKVETVKLDLVPEIYWNKLYTLQFKQKKKKTRKTKKNVINV